MFGFFSKKETPPVELTADVVIDATPQEVFTCLDPGAPDNRYLRKGWTVTLDPDNSGRLYGTDPQMPELGFVFDIVEYGYPSRLTVRSSFADGQDVGALISGTSAYTLTALPEGGCRVELVETAVLVPGLNAAQVQQETAMLVVAVNDDLARLKALIETGVEAAEKAGMLDEFFAEIETNRVARG